MKVLFLLYCAAIFQLGGSSPLESSAFAQPAADHTLCERIIRDGGFRVSRNLDEYEKMFGADFLIRLVNFGRTNAWIDMGAGQGEAQLQYLRQGGMATTKAIAFERPFKLRQTDPEHFQFLSGRFLENIPDAEIGHADLITDVYGVLSYTPQLGLALAKYFRFLKVGGALYVHHDLSKIVIVLGDGRELFLPEWLRTLPGLSVEKVGPSADGEGWNSFRVVHGPGVIELPELELVSSVDGWPPQRIFRVTVGKH